MGHQPTGFCCNLRISHKSYAKMHILSNGVKSNFLLDGPYFQHIFFDHKHLSFGGCGLPKNFDDRKGAQQPAFTFRSDVSIVAKRLD